MLKAFRLIACTVFVSVGCLTTLANGQFEPWASKTDRAAVPKSRVMTMLDKLRSALPPVVHVAW